MSEKMTSHCFSCGRGHPDARDSMLCYFSHYPDTVDEPSDLILDAINYQVTRTPIDQVLCTSIMELDRLAEILEDMRADNTLDRVKLMWALSAVIFQTSVLSYKLCDVDIINLYTEQYAKESLDLAPTVQPVG